MVTITHGDRVLEIPAEVLSGPAGAVEAWLAAQPLTAAESAKVSTPSKRAAPAKEE